MKLKSYISKGVIILIAGLLNTGCDSIFRDTPHDKLSEPSIWESEQLIDGYQMPWYRNMSDGFSTFVTTIMKGVGREYLPWYGDQMTVSKADWYSGDYGDILKSSMQEITRRSRVKWSAYYTQIYSINKLIENEGKIAPGAHKTRVMAEAHFFRAYYYYQLLRNYGGVLLLEKNYDPLVDKTKYPRASYQEMVEFITKEATLAAADLPTSYSDSDKGRVTKGAALMLKAKTYFWASGVKFQNREKSYLGFPDNRSDDMLTKAAQTYDELMKLSYSLVQLQGNSKDEIVKQYRNLFLTKNSPESILEVQHSNDGNFSTGFGHKLDRESSSPFFGGTICAYVPTQNHVNEYRTINGKMISEAGSGYDPANPYLNRDYRFYANILYDGCTYRGHVMNIHYTMQNGTEVPGEDLVPYGSSTTAAVSKTGYYLGKFVNETQTIDNNTEKASNQNYIIWRYAEVLLDYAEIDFKQGRIENARDKINQIRRRVHMPELTTVTWDDIVNERRVELAFEETTYWDFLRWGVATSKMTGTTNPLKGVKIIKEEGKPTVYKDVTVNGRNTVIRYFREMQYFLPISWDDIKYHQIEQNPDWREV